MNPNAEEHLDVLQNIEFGLNAAYSRNPELTDQTCIIALDNAKIAVKQHFGFAKNETVTSREDIQPIIAWCVTVGKKRIEEMKDLTLKEYVTLIEKVRRSVVRHSKYGRRAYYEFIKQFMH